MRAREISPWQCAAAALLLALGWQALTVAANYGGNWSALFCTGEPQAALPLVRSEHIYIFRHSTGFDGVFYHFMAHDPLLRNAGSAPMMDDARLRYRRILAPALAYLLALGRGPWIDNAYRSVCLLSIALGVYWSCRLVRQAGLPTAWGMLFLLLPAVPITVDRLVADATLAALVMGFLVYVPRPSWKLWLVLACAALTRETGLLLAAGFCGSLAWRRQWRSTAIFALSAFPALAWYGYVQTRTSFSPYPASLVPLSAILHALAHPWRYPAGTPLAPLVTAGDYLALGGVLLAFALALAAFARQPRDPVRIVAALFAVLGIVLQRTGHWQNVYDFGRVYTPLLAALAAMWLSTRNFWLLAPGALMLPRIAMQLAPQALGIANWLWVKK
jgi:hypothetical protein